MEEQNPMLNMPSARVSRHSDTLSGVFTVDRVLQKAIFGEVLLVSPVENQGPHTRQLVLKAVSKKLAEKRICKRGTKVFENHGLELQLLKQVRSNPHPNLLGLAPDKFQFESSDYRYTALPYLEGGELFGVVDAAGALGEQAARHILQGVASGLDHLHSSLGFAHNDVSLENVLLSRHDVPVLCDYGLAKRIGSRWDAKRCISGKLPYQAPEIYFGTATKSSGQGDVFSLGVTLFVLLCGIPPFDLPDPMNDQRYRYIQMGRMQELLDLWQKDVPEGAVDLLSKMLLHDPSVRITIKEVLRHPWVRGPARVVKSSDVFMEMEMDFGAVDDEDHMGEVEYDEEEEGDEAMDEEEPATSKSSSPRICCTPRKGSASGGFVGNKASPDSIFSFETAYANHTQTR